MSHLSGRQAAQFIINQRQQLLSRLRIPGANRVKDLGHLFHAPAPKHSGWGLAFHLHHVPVYFLFKTRSFVRHLDIYVRGGETCRKCLLVTGGFNGTNALAGAELYDLATKTWTNTSSMIAPRGGRLLLALRPHQV